MDAHGRGVLLRGREAALGFCSLLAAAQQFRKRAV
jgi:hypothetical protein